MWGNGELKLAGGGENLWIEARKGQGGCKLYEVALRNSLIPGNPRNIGILQIIFRISVWYPYEWIHRKYISAVSITGI